MTFLIACPNCGRRPYTEFAYSGEFVPVPPAGESFEDNFERVWLKENAAGVRPERWFHQAGCRRWLTIARDTRTNDIHDGVA